MSHKTMETFFNRARTGLLGAQNDADAAASLSPFGYDAEHVGELLDLLERTEAAYRDQQIEYSEQYESSHILAQKKAALLQKLVRHRRIARVVVDPDESAYSALGLRGETERSYDGLVQQARKFYGVLLDNDALNDRLAELTLTREVVEQAFDDVKAVEAAHNERTIEMKEAQDATETRDDLYDELRGRMNDFFEVARIATHERPQVREALGLVAPSE